MIVGKHTLSVCIHTNCIITYVDATKNIHWMGIRNKHIKSLVIHMQMKRNENA